MSDEVRATNFGCCDRVGGIGGDNDWLEWLIILGIIFFFLCSCNNNLFGRGCCR